MALKEDDLFDGIRDRVSIAIMRIKNFEPMALQNNPAGYYVCISGGKDSSVIQELCLMAGVKCELDVFFENYGDPDDWRWRCKKYKALLKDGCKNKPLRCAACKAGKEVESRKLKPCPLCGGLGALKHLYYANWIVTCIECGARGPKKPTGEEAAESWNRRSYGA